MEDINDYRAGGYTENEVCIVQTEKTLQQLVQQLDLTEVHAAYIHIKDDARLKLLSGSEDSVDILAIHVTVGKLWNKSKVYSQASKNSKPTNYRTIAYSAQVGNFRTWFAKKGFKTEHIKQADAALILDPSHVFPDGRPRPYPKKLATVKIKGTQDYILTTHELIRKYIEGDQVPTLDFNPHILSEQGEFSMKLYAWAYPSKATILIQELEEVNNLRIKYKDSIIRGQSNEAVPSNDSEGLTRIYKTSKLHQFNNQLVKVGFIKDTEIPILIEKL